MLNLNGRLTYLDCSNRYCPFGMLDEDLQVEKGLVIQEKKAALLTFRPVITDSRRQIKTVGEINENGDLYLQTEIKLCGYPAIGMREAFDRDSSEAIDQLLKDMHQEEVEIGHIDIQDLEELENPVTINIRYKLPRYAMKNLSIMYVPPPMITALRQNPFIPEKRIFNIDFPYSLEETENITLSFPAGFVLNEKPESVRIEQNDVYFNAYCFAKDNAVDFCRVFRRKRNHYTPEEYTFLKESYDKMVSSDQAQLVLSQDAH
jgi:hypothetical protein